MVRSTKIEAKFKRLSLFREFKLIDFVSSQSQRRQNRFWNMKHFQKREIAVHNCTVYWNFIFVTVIFYYQFSDAFWAVQFIFSWFNRRKCRLYLMMRYSIHIEVPMLLGFVVIRIRKNGKCGGIKEIEKKGKAIYSFH